MDCPTCSQVLQFVRFYEGNEGFMAEFYCDTCFKRKISRVKTEFFDGTPSSAQKF